MNGSRVNPGIDKDNICPPLPPPNESSYFITLPSIKHYHGCCTGFFFALGSHIPKTIRRMKKAPKYLHF
ncbi:MAG: aminoglycoside 6-adenylyltransferase [Spirochaetales bacterium]|nr:aminoglycoside 6-adenylyltransferase [Spirochaetales bacterium]